jgi:hypothetical protein
MRYSNVFGPRQDPKSEAGVVSIFVSRVLAGRPMTVFGDGTQTRDYVFVRDVARANVLAGTAAVAAGDGIDATAFNIATGRERTVLDVAAAVMQVIGRTVPIEFAPARPGELLRSVLDTRKAEERLGLASRASVRRWTHRVGDLVPRGGELMLQGASPIPRSSLDLVLIASPETKVVVAITAIFSLVSWFIIVAKWWQFRRLNKQADRFFSEMERATRLQEAYHSVMKQPPSPYNRLFREAITFYSELKPGSLRDDRPTAATSLTPDPARGAQDGPGEGGRRRA